MATVELRSITKSFDDVRVLNDINLAIQDKEFIVFVGPSDVVNPRFCASLQVWKRPQAEQS